LAKLPAECSNCCKGSIQVRDARLRQSIAGQTVGAEQAAKAERDPIPI